jgi:bifunctional DNA-binding transcriptional regulator/antitoxin component of YhaV-PrlF toxin-antitoxin module
MTETKFSRKIDGTGRFVIPSKLREEFNLTDGSILQFWTHEQDGRKFICIECPTEETEVERAMRVLREHGIIPS